MAHPQVADGGDGIQIWRVAADIVNKQSRQPTRCDRQAWGLDKGLKTSSLSCYEMLQRVSDLAGSCEHGNEPLGIS
jgi:hypothetical protein